MNDKKPQRSMDGLAALTLFGVFAVCVLTVLLTGARAYRGLTERDRLTYERRTCVQYLAARVHRADRRDAVTVEPFDGVDALVLADEDGYVTRVYCYDGYLMELYAEPDAGLAPEDGEQILPLSGLSLTLEDGLLCATLTDSQGQVDDVRLYLRAGEVAP